MEARGIKIYIRDKVIKTKLLLKALNPFETMINDVKTKTTNYYLNKTLTEEN